MSCYLNLLLMLVLTAWLGSALADDGPPATLPVPADSAKPDPEALKSLAVKYEHAEGVPRDYLKAAALYCQAARLGDTGAQYALGWMYANGRGVARDDHLAAHLFAMAAEQGHVHAQAMAQRLPVSFSAPSLPACLQPEAPTDEKEAEEESEAAYRPGPIFRLVQELAPRYQIDPKLAMAIISVESGFNVQARSARNAQGLMQLIPETAQRFRVKNAFDAADNIKGGLAYLRWLLAFFRGDVTLVVAAYNAGEHAVEKYHGIPPYPETMDYVRKIRGLYKKTVHPYSSNPAEEEAGVSVR